MSNLKAELEEGQRTMPALFPVFLEDLRYFVTLTVYPSAFPLRLLVDKMASVPNVSAPGRERNITLF